MCACARTGCWEAASSFLASRFPGVLRAAEQEREMQDGGSSELRLRPLSDGPTWQASPPPGLHLDGVKGDKLIEKLIIDEKKYYLFGRNPDLSDFTIDHQSHSGVHAAHEENFLGRSQ